MTKHISISDQLFQYLVKHTDGPVKAISEILETLTMVLAASSHDFDGATDEINRMLKSENAKIKFAFYKNHFEKSKKGKDE